MMLFFFALSSKIRVKFTSVRGIFLKKIRYFFFGDDKTKYTLANGRNKIYKRTRFSFHRFINENFTSNRTLYLHTMHCMKL